MKVIVRSSPQHGKGVFAAEKIRSGEVIMVFTGPVLRYEQVQPNEYHLQISEDLYLGASGDADDYVNHSCEPNAGFRGGPVLVAIRDIEPHEEITWDYSTAIDEDDFQGFPCQCGATGCRGRVHSFRNLDMQTRERLKMWLLPYLREKYYPGSGG